MLLSIHYNNIGEKARSMISSAVQNVNNSKPKNWTSKHSYLVFVHFVVVLLVFRGAHKFQRRTGAIYPMLTSSRQHFLSAVRPYSSLNEVDRQLAGTDYLQAPQLHKSHVDALRVLVDDYIQFHKRNRHNATRILIYRPRRTGLGDRLNVLAFAFWAASVSQRLFLVDWQYPFPLTQLLQNANSDVDLFFSQQTDDPKNETLSGNSSSKVVYLKPDTKGLKEYESTILSKVRVVIIETHYHVPHLPKAFIEKRFPAGVLPSYVNGVASTITFLRIVYHHVFKLSNEMLQHQKHMSESMRIRPIFPSHLQTSTVNKSSEGLGSIVEEFDESARPYIAVHARVGTGVGEAKGARFLDISGDMKTGALCLASRAVRLAHMSGNPPLPIYLATDTPSFRTIFREVVANFSHGRVEVVGGDWDVMHINAFTLPDDSGVVRTPKQQKALRDMFVDFVMLGHAEHMIALYSSFPRMAQGVGTARTLTELRNEVCFKVEKWK